MNQDIPSAGEQLHVQMVVIQAGGVPKRSPGPLAVPSLG